MSVSSTVRKAGPFLGNGSASVFPFGFKVFTSADLCVIRLDTSGTLLTLALTTDYIVTLNPNQDSNPGGSITLVAGALATGYSLVVTTAIPELQNVVLQNLGAFFPDVINDALDRLTILIQQMQEQTDRSIKFPSIDPVLTSTLPAVASRKGLLLGFDPTSGDAVAVAGAVNPSSGPFLGNLVGNVTSAGISTFKRLNGLRFLEGYGAVCDGVTDDSVALAAAIADVVATSSTLVLPAGKTVAYGTAINITSGNFSIVGGTGAKLKFTGSGIAFKIDGTGISNGAGNIQLRDFAIDAGASGTNALYLKKVGRSHFVNIECRGATAEAFVVDFGVSNKFENLTASSNNGAFSVTPTKGLLVTNASGTASSNNTFVNPKFEGINGNGIEIVASDACVFIGGTSEGNTGEGIKISGTSVSNTFIGTDIESNSGTHDIELVDGSVIRGTQFINMTVGRDLMVGTTSKETSIHGGNITTVTINTGATATLLDGGVRYSTLTDNGSGTNRIGENAATSNMLSFTQFKGNPILTNNIPLQAISSGGTVFPLLWWTSADQTLIQYLTAGAAKIRNTNGTVCFTFTDALNSSAYAFAAPSLTVGSGTSVSKIAKYTATLSPVAVPANSTSVQFFTVNGIASGDVVVGVMKPTAQAGLSILSWYNNGTNSLGLTFFNNTAAPITPTASELYSIVVMQ